MKRIEGLIAAAYPPLDKNGSLNVQAIPQYLQFLINNKVDGVFLNGSTGDFASLSMDERKQIVEEWDRCKPPEFKMMVHVGDTNVNHSIELARHASEFDVGAISALAPYYTTPNTVSDLVLFCRKIAQVNPDIPFYYYHIPQLTNCYLDMVQFIELAGKAIPNFKGLKYSHEDLMQFKCCLNFDNGKYDVLFGVDEILICSLALGGKGAVGSTYNHLAPLHHKMIEAFNNGEIETAQQLQYEVMVFVKTLSKYGFHAASKSTLNLLGLDLGPVRLPQKNLSTAEITSLEVELKESRILDWVNTSNVLPN